MFKHEVNTKRRVWCMTVVIFRSVYNMRLWHCYGLKLIYLAYRRYRMSYLPLKLQVVSLYWPSTPGGIYHHRKMGYIFFHGSSTLSHNYERVVCCATALPSQFFYFILLFFFNFFLSYCIVSTV